MPAYKAPVRDINFVLNDVLNIDAQFDKFGVADCGADTRDAILAEAAKFSEEVLSPIYQSGDQEGCQWSPDGVTTPTGFKEAYQQFAENGWTAIAAPEEFGGMGLPGTIAMMVSELSSTANWAFSMYPGLSKGAWATILAHGTQDQKDAYAEKLVTGEWTGTMCLTEPHCGSDLGMLKTKAEPNADGSYAITGTKIFISAGEHDLADNIVHIVLARLPDAPSGTQGISLFIVPKFLPDSDGGVGDRNTVSCGSIEHKMGINASATCVMNFDGATGFLLGPENRGLNCMFTFMNQARIGTALQGLTSSESSYQGALAYARERLQMRSLSGPKNPAGPADPIIVHPDVRRMLMTQKAFAEGGRAMIYWLALLDDQRLQLAGSDEGQQADQLLGFLTPIAKAFLTETSIETTNLGMQVFGGHGYIREWGMEQIARDARIGAIYEGTTGIQALDLLGRKILASKGEILKSFMGTFQAELMSFASQPVAMPYLKTLGELAQEWGALTQEIGAKAMQNPDEIGAASVDYLMFSGYVVMAYLWLKMAVAAAPKAESDPFYQAKLVTAEFYFKRILPRTQSHAAAIRAGGESMMSLDQEHFAF